MRFVKLDRCFDKVGFEALGSTVRQSQLWQQDFGTIGSSLVDQNINLAILAEFSSGLDQEWYLINDTNAGAAKNGFDTNLLHFLDNLLCASLATV